MLAAGGPPQASAKTFPVIVYTAKKSEQVSSGIVAYLGSTTQVNQITEHVPDEVHLASGQFTYPSSARVFGQQQYLSQFARNCIM